MGTKAKQTFIYRSDADNQLRTACYEVLNSFVANVGQDELPSIAQLCTVIMERLEKTVALRGQIVSTDDRITLEEMQTSLAVVLMVRIPAFSTAFSIPHINL